MIEHIFSELYATVLNMWLSYHLEMRNLGQKIGHIWRKNMSIEVNQGVIGPTITLSLGRAKYLLTFVDDFSHFPWIYTNQSKDEAFETL
jgi:hypothetical protein